MIKITNRLSGGKGFYRAGNGRYFTESKDFCPTPLRIGAKWRYRICGDCGARTIPDSVAKRKNWIVVSIVLDTFVRGHARFCSNKIDVSRSAGRLYLKMLVSII